MNALNITRQNQSCFAHLVRRGTILITLLLAFLTETRAEKYYVIYYDEVNGDATIRHYVSISRDGTSVVDETNLSLRCYWEADKELTSAIGGKGENLKGTTNNDKNQANRKLLKSAAFSTAKYLVEDGGTIAEADVANGRVYNLSIKEGTVTSRWLMDNEIDNAPILYQYYHKQYIYYEYGWKYSSAGYSSGTVAKMIVYDVIPLIPPHIDNITYTDEGIPQVTLSAEEGCSIYYTTDGSEPTRNSELYSSAFPVNNSEAIIKAIAIKNSETSNIAKFSLAVTLDDREEHSWTYYSGIDVGAYKTKYADKLYSPNPRDIKITYYGNGGTVSVDEYETAFVYYKTLEQGDNDGEYPYTVISNPFSKRPVVDGKVQGFGGWKVISGGEYIKNHKDNDILSLDEGIVFEKLKDDSLYEIKFEATWEDANITYLDNKTGSFEYTSTKTTGTYETNFLVLKCNPTSITLKSPCTITMVEPDGSADYRNTYTGSIVPSSTGTTKIEYTHWNPTAAIDAKGRNFTIGRGMKMDGTKRALNGTNTTGTTVDQILKIESGKFTTFEHFGENPNNIVKQYVTFGCDYDRAKSDNKKLEFTDWMRIAYDKKLPTDSDSEICRVYSLSGSFLTGLPVSAASAGNCYYFNVRGTTREVKGHRYLEILGGEWKNIAGGWGPDHDSNMPAFTFRMKGGHIIGSIYGGAEYQAASGTRTFIITGGSINGWVAGGSNGTRTDGGVMEGESFIYIGGNAKIDSRGSSIIINRAVGGNVFGAGCGFDAKSESGQVTLGTNVVIADNAYVERGVYGGGSYGYTEATSNIYITGGTIGGKVGGVNGASYNSDIQGGVYGGACQNKGGSVNIYMTGGTVNGGIYGGSNASGTLSGDVNIKISGGKVGESSQKTASIYGGGYGSGTTITGNTNITMTGGSINGNVFGGGNQGVVNSNATVTITGGTVTGNVYGGGNQAKVIGTTRVTIGKE